MLILVMWVLLVFYFLTSLDIVGNDIKIGTLIALVMEVSWNKNKM